MTFVLDASVTLAWILGDESVAEADAVLDGLETDRAVVPALWVSETANGVLTAVRRKRIGERDASTALESIEELPIEVVAETREALRRVHRLGVELDLTAYDATYLDLAIAARVTMRRKPERTTSDRANGSSEVVSACSHAA